MDEYIAQYLEHKAKLDYHERKVKQLRENLLQELKKQNRVVFEKGDVVLKIQKGSRSVFTRKQVPKEIFQQYASHVPYENLMIRKRHRL